MRVEQTGDAPPPSKWMVDLLLMVDGSLLHSYYGVAKCAGGRPLELIAQAVLILYSWGTLIIYMIVISAVLCGDGPHPGVLHTVLGQHWYTDRTYVLLLLNTLIVFPLSCLKDLSALRFTR